MAIAAEALSPEATEAVSAAAAGRGARLTPEVAKELRRRVVKRATTAKAAPAKAASPGVSLPSPKPVVRAATAINNQGAKAISGGHGGMAARLIFAFGAGLLALELASYLSGRYFTYSVGKGAKKVQAASQHIGLYPGQTAKLQASAKADALTHLGVA